MVIDLLKSRFLNIKISKCKCIHAVTGIKGYQFRRIICNNYNRTIRYLKAKILALLNSNLRQKNYPIEMKS